MKGTLKLEDGREFTVELGGKALDHLEEPKRTGYERVKPTEVYYYFNGFNVHTMWEDRDVGDGQLYNNANYYSDKTVAENNFRADALIHKLRRFAVEHRESEINWEARNQEKYFVVYNRSEEEIIVDFTHIYQGFSVIYFDTEETAKAAIEEFKDELIWYFTEYKNSL